ncbi:hypothetical protein SpCBS45565_g04951 [Spizellomyces sp. 'palustris']|nr:hypothetical protein SpCBS45565_g04951 [Spizellomyces sp. 'palustris']
MRSLAFLTTVALMLPKAWAAPTSSALTDADMQKARLDFLTSSYNATATPDMIKDLSTPAIKQVSENLAHTGSGSASLPSTLMTRTSDLVARAVSPTLLNELKRHQAYAAAAYCLKFFLNKNWDCRERCTSPLTSGTVITDYFTKSQSVGYVAYNDAQRAIIVAFRGSLTPSNFANDMLMWKTELCLGGEHLTAPSDAQIHYGFQNTYLAARDHVRAAVGNLLNHPQRKNYAIHVAGHSLGGAISVLSAVDLLDHFGNTLAGRITVYTYGEPRVGNAAYARWVNSLPISFHRVTGWGDVVTSIPLRDWGYLHHEEEYYIPSKSNIRECSGANALESSSCINAENLAKNVALAIVTPLGILSHLNHYFDITFGPWC